MLAALRGEAGLPPTAQVELAGNLEEDDAPPLGALLALLPRRSDLAGAELAVRAARADARLQGRLGVPLPSLSFQGGRENEYFAQGGLEVPLPIYQRNQTARAVAAARVATRQAERVAALARAEAELRAAYASYEGARGSFAALRAADDAVGLTERLATRAYELGQRDLASVLVARRTAAEARQRRLEALVALGRAQVAVDQAAAGPRDPWGRWRAHVSGSRSGGRVRRSSPHARLPHRQHVERHGGRRVVARDDGRRRQPRARPVAAHDDAALVRGARRARAAPEHAPLPQLAAPRGRAAHRLRRHRARRRRGGARLPRAVVHGDRARVGAPALAARRRRRALRAHRRRHVHPARRAGDPRARRGRAARVHPPPSAPARVLRGRPRGLTARPRHGSVSLRASASTGPQPTSGAVEPQGTLCGRCRRREPSRPRSAGAAPTGPRRSRATARGPRRGSRRSPARGRRRRKGQPSLTPPRDGAPMPPVRTSKHRPHALVATLALLLASCSDDPTAPTQNADAGADAVDAPARPRVRLLVDANRDGTVSDTGDDEAFRASWDATHGAVFLANVDDDDDDDALDGADDVVNGDADAADLARVRVAPIAGLSEGSTGRLTLTGPETPTVRVFRVDDGAWRRLDLATETLSTADLRAGVELGVESSDFPTADWAGEITLSLAVTRGDEALGEDRAVLRVAPFVVSSSLDEATRIYATGGGGVLPLARFINDLDAITAEASLEFETVDGLDPEWRERDRGPDVWTEDYMEFGWTAMPGGDAPRGMNVVMRTPRPDRRIAAWTRRDFVGPDRGYVWNHSRRYPTGRAHDPSLDSFGNLEVLPPYAGHPLGRLFHGNVAERSSDPVLREFLNAQRVQGPVLEVDTSWLLVGHVDEVVSFIPAARA
ncbi:MAG: TolC family protein [Deltaproteobacteria bacterium]|nr:TolC family protein [Deltaproteobacteria bacterium]